jgi:AraC family transcriptional regulator
MRVELDVPESLVEPRIWLEHEQVVAIALCPGSIMVGSRRSEMKRLNYQTGEMGICPRGTEVWFSNDGMQRLSLSISDAALAAACDRTDTQVELRPWTNLVDARLGALAMAGNAERVAGFPSGRLFLDHLEMAIAVALVKDYAVQPASLRIFRGGLSPARLRRIKELVHAKLDHDLTLEDMAQSVDLSITHFCQMFRKSTGQSPHQFVLRHRVERAKEMLRNAEARVLDVAVACGFKTQQHFARVFRTISGTSPTEYRRESLQ